MMETQRLFLRAARRTDIPRLYEFLGDRKAMRFTHVDASERECRRRVLVHEWFRRRDGCAPWVISTRSDNKVVGWGGLYRDPFDPGWGFEVGYFFHPDAWGRGYASELVAAALEIADEQMQLPEVWAMAHPDNHGSQRVLAKAGFRATGYLPEKTRFLYRRTRRGSITRAPFAA